MKKYVRKPEDNTAWSEISAVFFFFFFFFFGGGGLV